MNDIAAVWRLPATITPNNFVYKSLSNWACNVAVGCDHGCRFCYVPSASTNRMASTLEPLGVNDPDEEWGHYVFPRPWDGDKFRKSLRDAERTPVDKLKPDGNRAVMFCSTTDPYQVIHHRDPAVRKQCQEQIHKTVYLALRTILEESTLRVRILTRGPLARRDFDIMRDFGNRLLFGMSLPTLNEKLAKVYEPKAPSPRVRLDTLRRAKAAGLHVYVAMAPTYPECDESDLYDTLSAIKQLDPVTVFHEPINIRADNVARIEKQAREVGVKVDTSVFQDANHWSHYAFHQLTQVEACADWAGLSDRLHLWPDKSLERYAVDREWLTLCWNRISEWPK